MDCTPQFESLNYPNNAGALKGRIFAEEVDMNVKIKSSLVFKLLIACLLIHLCVACTGGTALSPGAWVQEADRIAVLDGGPHKGNWQTRDLTINYDYQEAVKNLQISGVIEFADYIPMGFNTLEYLKLYIHFVGADGTVLDTRSIKIFGYRRYLDFIGEMSFNHRYDLTENTVSFAFSYSGRVTQGGGTGIGSSDRGRIDWDFWKVPRRNPPK
jgi:hypothetical protein